MKIVIEKFNIIGIAVRTTNENSQSGLDLPALWNKFLEEKIAEKIPNKVDDEVYCVYTDYEADHTKPYTAILGCKVSTLDEVPQGMIGKEISEAQYRKTTAKGSILKGIIFEEWVKIWNAGFDRTFTTDFEVYGEKAQNPECAEVDIFVSVRKQ